MEYDHERAVADSVDVDLEFYKSCTKITERGGMVEAQPEMMLGYGDKQTRAMRREAPGEDLSYNPQELDRPVFARDQIRTVIRALRDRLPIDIFPGRNDVPETLIQAFRNHYEPRIALIVDLVATGTDIRPIDIVIFMAAVKSRVLFEQMKGRGVRIIDLNDLRSVGGEDAVARAHFVIVDCVGMTETELADTQPLDRMRTVSLAALPEHVAIGGTDPGALSSLASRLGRLDKQCGPEEHTRVVATSGGVRLTASRGQSWTASTRRQSVEARRAFTVPRGGGADGEAGQASRRDPAEARNGAACHESGATLPSLWLGSDGFLDRDEGGHRDLVDKAERVWP